MVVYPYAVHIAVQQPFRPLWSLLLLHDNEPSQVSFAVCFKSLLMLLLPASEEFIGVSFSQALLSSGSYHLLICLAQETQLVEVLLPAYLSGLL